MLAMLQAGAGAETYSSQSFGHQVEASATPDARVNTLQATVKQLATELLHREGQLASMILEYLVSLCVQL